MTPDAFISKWKASTLKERSAAQEHFVDLCHLLGEPTPSSDPTGSTYCFERGALKTTGGKGWADVWKRGHFGWEYKGKGADLQAAFAQLQKYVIALENPPLLVVCDLERFHIHTNWNNTVSERHEMTLEDLRDPAIRQKLKAVLSDPEKLRPGLTRHALTEHAASDFARLAQRLRDRDHTPEQVAHFIQRLVFCMFAEDVDLLPDQLFARMLMQAKTMPGQFTAMASELFRAMRSGGMAAWQSVDWFNGGLFDDDTVLPLDREDIELVASAAALDWADIDPTIFGTLFERGLDPGKRSQLGAHYTDRAKIMLIIEPVIIRPLLAEWEVVKASISEALGRSRTAKSASARTKAQDAAVGRYRVFLTRLRGFTVLDPACGSGNFLYLALLALKDLEQQVMIEAETLDPVVLPREFPAIGPAAVKGIEINGFAAELARITVWIGEIQWMRRNGWDVSRNPILKPLDTIECRDALLNTDGTEAQWPKAEVIVGNPPFLGVKKMIRALGEDYTGKIRSAYAGRVSPSSDLVCWWFVKAREAILSDRARRAGLVATNSVRGGKNRLVLDEIVRDLAVRDAWSDEEWVNEGAAVRVSLVSFDQKAADAGARLNGTPVEHINADLTSAASAVGLDLTRAKRLKENAGVGFVGIQKTGPFDVPGSLARQWLLEPANPNGRKNADLLKPYRNGLDITRRPRDVWLLDFGVVSDADAPLFESPYAYADQFIRPFRQRSAISTAPWLRLWRPRPEMHAAVKGLVRFIVTPEVSKYRLFSWLDGRIAADKNLTVIAKDDDTTFGILHSRFHEAWSLGLCTWLGAGNDPRYTPTTTFETFPFPHGLTPDLPAATYAVDPRAVRVAAAAKRLDELRRNWLNPADLVRVEPEVVPGFPDRILPVNAEAAAVLKTRTLTNLYNLRPEWLDKAHRELNTAVAAAYDWPEDITTDDALARLLELNRERAAQQGSAPASAPADDKDRDVA
ncbi:class I SAM-dependent DNA methyltransferase [Methylobacterium nonmethylotrophicum]|uniref:site-specific DNA-methyltransferase (adenine-specific) n=2 Tax=Methylobacterium nonmethylotrophicum TaxID=1141884 RepID=A0A4Z0NV88_9HYPH|nr:class I SAM-dependent DNA methyltransferase [Methylobacterium nonmethylotrophicum]